MSEPIILKRDIVRIPQRFINHRKSQGKHVPNIVAESNGNRAGFGHYYIRRDDPIMDEVVKDAEWWVAPDGPFRQGNVVKAARYFLRAVRGDSVTQLRSKIHEHR